MKNNVTTRFPPSPTGYLQIGNVRTALFNYLYARQNGGRFVVRIEDTDKERSRPEYEEAILTDLSWLGFAFDDFARQSDRAPVHQKYLETLIAEGKAYVSKEVAGEGKRDSVIRFKNPNTSITFEDVIRGDITIDTTDLGDFVIARAIDDPLYHLGVVIDDYEMGITHVIRGEDHISNTPRQILLLQAIGAPIPIYAHLPLVLAPDRSKLSKRNGSVSLAHLRERGYLPEAVINFLALLGWNPGTDQEIFSLEELITSFTLSGIQKSGGVFNIDRLNWYNREHMKRLSPKALEDAIANALADIPKLRDMFIQSNAARTDLFSRINSFGDIRDLYASGEFDFYLTAPTYTPESLSWKSDTREDTHRRISHLVTLIESAGGDHLPASSWKELLMPFAEEEGKGSVLWPLRYALSGRDRSPDPFTLIEALGRKEALVRLHTAVAMLE